MTGVLVVTRSAVVVGVYGVVAFGVGALRVSVIVVRLGDHVLIYTPPGYLCQRFV